MIIQVMSGPHNLLIVNLYNPSDNSVAPLLSSIDFPDMPTIITGDFNLHHPLWSGYNVKEIKEKNADSLITWMRTNNYTLRNVPGEHTYFCKEYGSTLDLTWTSNDCFNKIQHWGVRQDLHFGADHYPITWIYNLAQGSPNKTTPTYKPLDDLRDDWSASFTDKLYEQWDMPDYLADEASFLRGVEIMHEAIVHASREILTPKPHSPRRCFWFRQDCRKALREMREAQRRMRACKTKQNIENYRTKCQDLKKTIRLNKSLGAAEFASTVTPANVWRLNDWYRGNRRHFSPILKGPDGTFAVSPKEKTDMMHRAWFVPPKPLKEDFPYDLNVPLHNTRELGPVTVKEVQDTLKSTSNTSAPGPSGIGYKILKWALSAAPDEFVAIIRASVKLGIHHPSWKESLVCVIAKAKKPSYADPKAWRPIQLLECMGKLVEKIVARRIIYDLGRHNLSPMEQFGGRSNSSCYDAAISLTHDIQMAKKNKLISSFLAVDVKGFFDHIHHDRLIKVLYDMGFPLSICKWVNSFVKDRSAAIRLDDFISEPEPIHVGVPQGSPVSPVLACLYASEPLKDLVDNPVYAKTGRPVGPRAYVDDYGLLAIGHSHEENMAALEDAAQVLVASLDRIGLRIDPSKSDLMHFSWRKQTVDIPPLRINLYGKDYELSPPKTGFMRWLGVFLDKKLTYRHHIKAMTDRGRTITAGLQCLGNTIRGINQSNLRLLYQACILPVLTYAAPVWYNPNHRQKWHFEELTKVQNNALRRVLGAFKTTPNISLNILSFLPPIQHYIQKLSEGYALRIFRLPLLSPITHRLPYSHIENRPRKKPIPRPDSIPFQRPQPYDRSLGAEGVLPGRHIVSLLRVFKQFTHLIPSG